MNDDPISHGDASREEIRRRYLRARALARETLFDSAIARIQESLHHQLYEAINDNRPDEVAVIETHVAALNNSLETVRYRLAEGSKLWDEFNE